MKILHSKTCAKIALGALSLMVFQTITVSSRAALTHEYSFNDPTTSTNAIDSVGGATGTLVNLSAGTATYPGDGTVLLNGGFVYLPNDIVSNYTSASFEVWTTPATEPTWARLFDFGSNTGGPGTGGGDGTGGNGTYSMFICLSDGSGLYRGDLSTQVNGDETIQGPSPAPAAYHHVVFTIDAVAKTAALYDDGAQVAFYKNWINTPQAMGHTFNDYIGRSQFGADPMYNGSVDEFRIYNNTLSPDQVEADYEAGAGVTNASSGSVTALQFTNPTNVLQGAIITPNLLATYSGLTNLVNISTVSGIVYSSGNTNIIYFGTDGNYHVNGLGSATITAQYGGQTANLTVFSSLQPSVLLHRWSFNGAAGSTAINDSVGNANGTLVNSTTTSELDGSGHLVLDGNLSSAYVSLPSGIMAPLTNATFEVWMEYNGGATWAEAYSFGTNNGSSGLTYTTLIPQNGANQKLRWGINENGEVDLDAPGTMAISNEVCVTVAYNYTAQSVAMYINGRKVSSGAQSKALYTIPDGDNYFGRSQFSGDPYLPGMIDEMRIYSGVESDQQIAIDTTTGPDNIVTNPGTLNSLTVIASTNVDVHGLPVPVQVLANFANVSNVDVSTLPGTVITSSDPTIVNIANGNVVPVSVGVSTVNASYSGLNGSVQVTVFDTNAWPSLLHRWKFDDAYGSTTITDSVGTITGTLNGPTTLTNGELQMPLGNPAPSGGQPTAASGWASFPPGQGLVTSLPNEASFELWVVWNGGGVWQEAFDFGQAATPGVSSGGGEYVMICPYDGASGSLRAEWDQNQFHSYDFVLSGPKLDIGVLSQVVWTHDQDRQLDFLYRNGVLVASGQNTGLWNTLPDTDNWMARDEWPDPMFNGDYVDFRIWSGALTAGEVSSLYKAGPDTVVGPGLRLVSSSGGQITLAWPANASGFTLKSAPNLVAGPWTPVSGTPTVVNGLNTLTITPSGSQTYFRLQE